MPVVICTCKQVGLASCRYSSDNGYTFMEYDDGQYYDVPPFVAAGMFARGWAQLVPPGGLQPRQDEPPSPPSAPVKEPEQNGGDDDDDDEARAPLKSKKRR